MALSSKFRWVTVGKLKIDKEKRAPVGAAIPSLDLLINGLTQLSNSPNGLRPYQNEQKRMWCTPVSFCDSHYHLLLHVGDKTVSDMAYIDFITQASRDGGKTDTEGGHFCSHVLIKKAPDIDGKHLFLLEKVPGLNFTTISAHFNWVLSKSCCELIAENAEGDQKYRAIAEIVGFQSKTIQEAMTTGTVMDLQFVGHEKLEEGLDEEDVIRERSLEAKWSVGRTLNQEKAKDLLKRGMDYLRGWDKVEEDDKELLIRIKSRDGQIRTVPLVTKPGEADAAATEALESAFILNEFMGDFEVPLTQRYNGIRADVVQRMRRIGNDIGG